MIVARRETQLDLWGAPIAVPERQDRGFIPLNFLGCTVRMIVIKGVTWWVARDVCRVLDIINVSAAVDRLDDDEKTTIANTDGRPGSGPQTYILINEPGLYSLIFTSRKSEVKEFKRWVTHEVLPEIRRTGTYNLQSKRLDREIKRLKINPETAKARCDQFANNLLVNRELADDGHCPNDFAAIYNAIYRGQFDADAPALRALLDQRKGETPLDRMGYLPLVANAHIKAIAFERVRALGLNVPLSAKIAVIEDIAREMTKADLAQLGPGYYIGLKDDPKRGKIIDVVRNPLAIA